MVAAFISLISVWACGLWPEVKLAVSMALLSYWYYWWRQQQQVNWCVLYPDKVVLGWRGKSLPYSTGQISYWGLCFVVGKHCVWRDQVTPQQWRYLQVLKRW